MSDFLNYSIQTRQEFKDWILRQLGYPLVTIELTDDHLEDSINEAVETFTKYCSQETEYIAMDLSGYVSPSGLLLPNNVTSVFQIDDQGASTFGNDVNRLFSIPNVMLNTGMLAVPNPGESWNWINYEMSMEYLKLTRRMLGGGFQFEYNPRSKYLKLYPDPKKEGVNGWIVFSCNVIRQATSQYGERWVKRYALALAKIILGTVRGKFDSVQLVGGGSLNKEIKQEGISERDDLMVKLREEEDGVYRFFIG